MIDVVTARVVEMIEARGPDYMADIEARLRHRRERDCRRKKKARQQVSPEQHQRDRHRKRQARAVQTSEQRQREREQRISRKKLRPFMGVDGEGGGTDELGRQNYLMMMAADASGAEFMLSCQGKALATRDCLEFLLSLPAEPILVGYGIGYDTTQILRGIQAPKLRPILNPRQGRNGPLYQFWGDYAIIYQQGQYLRVARINRTGQKPAIMKGSCRTIYETLGFFQCSFVRAITNFDIGSEQDRARIVENKMRRDSFSHLTDEIIEYCRLECRYLAMLMTEFREICAAVGIQPKQWSGAGWLASALLEKHSVPKRPLTSKEAAALVEMCPS
jgi:hypothetical protein